MDPTGIKIAMNLTRLNDFYCDQILKHPNENLIKSNFPEPELICASEESIKWLLKDEFDNITKPEFNDPLQKIVRKLSWLPAYFFNFQVETFIGSEGIFTMLHGKQHPEEHEKWYKQRKLAALLFTQRNTHTLMYDIFVRKARIFEKVLDDAAIKGKLQNQTENSIKTCVRRNC